MSGRRNGDDVETLFSFELLVENIRVEGESEVSDELAVGLRLLDFPTLLIYQPRRDGGDVSRRQQRGQKHAFNRGKCCFFKMNLKKLHADVSSAPLYVMLLDVKEQLPKLVGTSLVSLATAVDGIRRDATEHGVSAASSHGERGLVGVRDLNGETIGSISLSYKLKSLGAGLPPQSNRARTTPEPLPLDCGSVDIQNQPSNQMTSMPEEKHSVQAEHKPGSQTPQTLEEDLTVFCPPHLFYNNSAEEKSTNEGCNVLNLDSEAFTFEDTHSEEDASPPTPPTVDHRVEKPARNHETSGVTPNDLGEALRQLPLLNALLVELSQLNGQNPQRPLSVHPNLSWIYRPASTEPSAGRSKTLQKTTPQHLRPPRHCSTPAGGPASVKPDLIQSSRSPRKKLVYGTTRTFNLRLKQLSPVEQKRRECIDLIQNATQSSVAKAKTKSSNDGVKSGKRKPALNRSCGLNENVETVMQSMQGTITLKQKTQRGRVHGKQGGSPRTSEKPSLFDSRCVHIPGVVGGDVEDEKLRGESSGVTSRAESHSGRENSDSADGSPESLFSDYADDFNSLEPSEAFTPDPASSPESSRAKTPRSPLRPDFQKRAVLPVPVKAHGSPQRALRVAVRPRTHASALSFSSSDEGSASLQTVLSGKPITTGSGRVERSSGAESLVSPRGQRSTEESGPGFSTDSISSFEPQEADYVEDELGSLDFKKEYRHISELVANKLPGYTT